MTIYQHSAVFVVTLIACTVIFGVGSDNANAERYESVTLGVSPLSYLEHRNSVNDAGDIAWTEVDELDSDRPKAWLTRAGQGGSPFVNLHSKRPIAADVSSRAEDINEQGDIAGYSSDSALELRRHAILWVRRSAADGDFAAVDLHASAQTGGGVYEQTSAYGVSERVGDFVYVAGYRRTSVTDQNNKGFSKPMLWKVDVSTPASPTVDSIIELKGASGANQYGIAYDVAVTPNGTIVAIGAIGANSGGSSPFGTTYQYAHRWRSNNSWNADAIPGTGSGSYATSAATRIIAFDGNSQNNNVWTTGYALSSAGQSDAFLNEYNTAGFGGGGTGGTIFGGQLTVGSNDGQISSGLGLAIRTDLATNGLVSRPTVVGGAATVAGGLNFSAPPSAFIFHGMYSFDLSAAAQVCDVEDDRPISAAVAQGLNDINANGAMVGMSGSDAVFLTPIAKEAAALTRYIRSPSNAGYSDYWWVEAPRTGSAAGQHGEIVFSDSLGCSVASGCSTGTLELDDSSADVVAFGGVRSVAGQFSAFTDKQTGAAPALKTYVQYSIANPGEVGGFACDISEAIETSSMTDVVNACSTSWPEPSATGFGGDWRNCITTGGRNAGCETDVRTSYDHCGTCGNSVNDNIDCTTDTCVAGVESNPINVGSCLISGGCYVDEDFRPGPYGGRNPCQSCEVDLSQTAWSNESNSTCCTNGAANLDSYDTSGGGAAPDRNRGDATAAVSDIAGKNDDNRWSNRSCNRGGFFNTCQSLRAPTCDGQVSTGTARFNPDVDTRDWYRFFATDNTGFAGADTNGNPEPRGRVILQDNFTARVCFYVDCKKSDRSGDLIPRRTDGTSWTSVANGPSGTPAAGGKGQCTTISGNGSIADLEASTASCDGDNLFNTDNEGWLVVSVEAVGASDLVCTSTDYKIRWGNDRENREQTIGTENFGEGCLDCCN